MKEGKKNERKTEPGECEARRSALAHGPGRPEAPDCRSSSCGLEASSESFDNSTCESGGACGRRGDGAVDGPGSGTIIAVGRCGRCHARNVRTHETVLHQGCGDTAR